jgi:hypothetical protein
MHFGGAGGASTCFRYSGTKNPAKIADNTKTPGGRLSKSKEGRRQVVYHVGEEILTALQAVFLTAQRALAYAPSGSTVNLAIPSNMMVGEAKAERFDHARKSEVREQLRRLLIEPFVARVEVEWESEGERSLETIYFPRRSAAGLTSAVKGALFVTSGAALGALAEHEAGETAVIPHRWS